MSWGFSAGSFVSVLSVLSSLSILSFVSTLSVFSTLSIASSFSVLSIASHASILSIGCENGFAMICNFKTYKNTDTENDKKGDILAASHKDVNCADDRASVTVKTESKFSKICSVDKNKAFVPSDENCDPRSTTDTRTCVTNVKVEKDQTVFLANNNNDKITEIANVPRYYDYNSETNYENNYKAIKTIIIKIKDKDDWLAFSSCTKEQKENDDEACEYKEATCTIDGVDYDCEVKRKGNSSWRSVDKKPSLKVKWKDKDNNFQYKFALNNNVQEKTDNAQIKAYNTFRKAGVIAPRASTTAVTIGFETTMMPEKMYTLVEEPRSFEFLGANGIDGSTIWEIDVWKYNTANFENADGSDFHEMGPNEDDFKVFQDAMRADLEDMWKIVDKEDMFRYYAGELASAHWDSFCRVPRANNVMIRRSAIDGKFRPIPWGVDQTMTCSFFVARLPTTTAFCGVMHKCFANHQCRQEYKTFVKKNQLPKPICVVDFMWGWLSIGATLVFLAFGALAYYIYSKEEKDVR